MFLSLPPYEDLILRSLRPSPDERDADYRLGAVPHIIVTEEVDKMLLFDYLQFSINWPNVDTHGQLTFDSAEKESPKHQDVNKEAENVTKHHLCSDGPPKEAKITGMPEPGVYAMLNELVSLTLLFLDVVVEVCSCSNHGYSSSNLTDYD